MKVFKFGGASIKNAQAIRNMCEIVSNHKEAKLLVVVSAMGKSTNNLELLLEERTNETASDKNLANLLEFHVSICEDLFPTDHDIFNYLKNQISELKVALQSPADYNEIYDQVVSKGELISSNIITAYLNHCGTSSLWVDAREYVRTDNNFREGHVDWKLTEELIRHDIESLALSNVLVTQGFIGRAQNGLTTTLGREGSDFSAAIFASCLSAESVTVWKDVPGILNGDPKLVKDAILFDELPYQEAAEMTYYGATVIHPKTIKPLANKGIPLHVKSFDHPSEPGTLIHDCKLKENQPPTIIIKNDQCLISFKVIDFTFVNEDNLSLIFKTLSDNNIKINIMQNSAISFSIVIDNDTSKIQKLVLSLKDHFDIRYNNGLQLITLKNYQQETLDSYRNNEKILLEQISRKNYRALINP
ncbi:aspartate kinase [Fulvivirga sediminis]|uniref:Aspartokinase n=1 Tax=Fulvivirga sediminis TaxID=2803949 RepID=A0A937F4Y0_9BACT|nr:aspartate kinase [Fulvivirga sediminis]MBL3656477.1 aspartate kinase [Fulvivirga sediminis]